MATQTPQDFISAMSKAQENMDINMKNMSMSIKEIKDCMSTRLDQVEQQVSKLMDNKIPCLPVSSHSQEDKLKLARAQAKIAEAKRNLAAAEIELAEANLQVTSHEIAYKEAQLEEVNVKQPAQEEPPQTTLDQTQEAPSSDTHDPGQNTSRSSSKKNKKKKKGTQVGTQAGDGQDEAAADGDDADNVSLTLSRRGPASRDKSMKWPCVRTHSGRDRYAHDACGNNQFMTIARTRLIHPIMYIP